MRRIAPGARRSATAMGVLCLPRAARVKARRLILAASSSTRSPTMLIARSLRRSAALLLLALSLASPAVLACRAPREDPAAGAAKLSSLDARHGPLRADFDRDAAHPRILVLASPT